MRCSACDQIGHQRSTSMFCRFNKKSSNQTNANDSNQSKHSRVTSKKCLAYTQAKENENNNKITPICKCGSDTHQRITFTDCPLNKKLPKNSLANRVFNPEIPETHLEKTYMKQRFNLFFNKK